MTRPGIYTKGREMNEDRNGLEWWFPRIEAAGLPVPKTIIIDAGEEWYRICAILDGENPPGFSELRDKIAAAGDEVGWPAFLRTGQGSGKHQWKDTCFLPTYESIPSHVARLIEWSETVDMMGLPYRYWAVREMLPTMPVCKLTAYGDFPLCREFRFFTKGGKVQCQHEYWPADSIEQGEPNCDFDESSLRMRSGDMEILTQLAVRAAAACPEEDWSIDFLWTRRGFFLTDMAIASRSFHWEGCEFA
jgi:hypothetical protein